MVSLIPTERGDGTSPIRSGRPRAIFAAICLGVSLIVVDCGSRSTPQQVFPVSAFPFAQGKVWTYAVGDAQGICDDTINIEVVGYSSALTDEETSIWRLHSVRDSVPQFFFEAETAFVARSVNRVIVQQQNQCFPHLTLNFPLVPGQWWRGPDPTVFDSVEVAGWDTLNVPVGTFPGALRIEEYRANRDSALARQIWIVPQIGIVKMQESSGPGAVPSRTWALVSFKA